MPNYTITKDENGNYTITTAEEWFAEEDAKFLSDFLKDIGFPIKGARHKNA